MTDNIANLIRSIKNRGAIVNISKGFDEIKRLELFLSMKLGSDFYEFYSCCNGFNNDESFMSIWSIEYIILSKIAIKESENLTIIGDFLMESDYIIADLSKNEANIKLNFENTVLSNNFKELLSNIKAGFYD